MGKVKQYLNGVKMGMMYGGFNIPLSEVPLDKLSGIPESMYEQVLEWGRVQADFEAKQKQAKIDKAKQTAEKRKSTTPKKGRVIYEDSAKGRVRSEMQKESIKVIEKLAEVMGTDIYLFDSRADGANKNYNGWYDRKTDSIHIDINAGKNHNQIMLNTFSHELTHFIKEWSPEKFKAFGDFLIEQYGEKGVSVGEMLERQMEKLPKSKQNPDLAFEELVASACETMLTDSKAVEKLMELEGKEPGIIAKIKEFIKNTLTKVRNLYKGIEPDSAEAKALREMEDTFAKLAEMFEDMAVDAVRTKQAVGKVESEGNINYSIREIVDENGKKYGVGVYLDSNLLTGLSESERKQMVKLRVMEELAGNEFVAYDNQQNPVKISIAKKIAKFKNTKGKRVLVNKDLISKNVGNNIKQSAVVQIDEIIEAADYITSEPSKYSHDWVDNYGKNDWDYWNIYIQEKNKAVWQATLNIANTKNGKKILYDINPIKMVEGSVKSDTTTTKHSVPHKGNYVNTNNMQNSAENSENSRKNSENSRKNSENSRKNSVREQAIQSEYEELSANPSANEARLKELVTDYAISKGYTTRVYHGTPNFGFTKINTFSGKSADAFFTTDAVDVAETYSGAKGARRLTDKAGRSGNYEFLAKTDGFLVVDAKGKDRSYIPNRPDNYDAIYDELNKLQREYSLNSDSKVLDKIRELEKQEHIISDIDKRPYSTDYIAGYAKDKGYRGVIVKNVKDDGIKSNGRTPTASNLYIFLHPEADVKSADAVTYDKDGSVIPLSERFNAENTDIRYSVRDYSYDTLISKPNMVVTALDADVPSDRKSVLNLAKTNAAKVGRVDENSNTVYVKVDDIDTEVIIGTNGLRHSIDRRFEINAPVAIKVGEVLKNSIKINELTPKNTEASETYVLAGVAKNVNKEPQIVTFVVNKFTNEVVEMDVLYSLNSKTEKSGQKNKSRPGANPQAFLQNADYLIDSTISISDLLEYVNRYFPDILPEDVLKHFGHKSRPEGTIGESALYSVRDKSDRELLAEALEENAEVIENTIDKSTPEGKAELYAINKYKAELKDYNHQQKILKEINKNLAEVRKTAEIAKKDIINFNNRIKNGETQYDGNDILDLKGKAVSRYNNA